MITISLSTERSLGGKCVIFAPVNPLHISEQATLPVPARELWRYLSDTDRLTRTGGLPAVRFAPSADRKLKGHYEAEARMGPLRFRYEELPFEWVENRYYRVVRRFFTG